jgi:predicted metal-dependent phosphoesterase TrpH
MRCDLHVHSNRSGSVDLPGLARFADESYSEPRAVYDTARLRGMDLVTLTDHDTIEGGLAIAHLPGTFLSEEVSCILPEGRLVHLGVFGLTEVQHTQVARLRADAEALFAYLAEQRLPACLNHPFSALTGRRRPSDLALALSAVPLVETRNGMMSPAVNAHAAAAARAARLGMVGGSDAHTLSSVAGAFTMAPAARDREEFLDALRRGLTLPAGSSGGYRRLTADVGRIMAAAYGAQRRRAADRPGELGRFAFMLGVLPLALPLLPLVTAGVYLQEQAFARRLRRQYLPPAVPTRRRRAASGPFGPTAAARPAR